MSEIDLTQFEGHTPGPWKVGYRALDIWAPSEKGGEAKIFDVRGWGYLTGKGDGALGLTEDQAIAIQTANANIAAAAPDLLAAYKAALARAEAAEAEVKRLEALELARANANARAERAERERATSDEVREMWFKKWCNADDERRNAERQRDEAWTTGAEAMREACEDVAFKNASSDDDACKIAETIRALPIPAQERK